jgi:hypothetical protein
MTGGRIMNGKITIRLMLLTLFTAALLAAPAFAGSLEPSAPPGPTMKTLDEIPPTWSQILPAAQRFKLVMGGVAVLDKETGLVWEQSPRYSTASSWDVAFLRCYGLNLGGRKGWLLPTIEELSSLIDETVPTISGSPRLPVGHPFNLSSFSSPFEFWSSTTPPYDTTVAMAISLENGGVVGNFKASDQGSVWCVRGGHGHDGQ